VDGALGLVAGWPVHAAAAGYVTAAGARSTGPDRSFPLASVTKLLTTLAVLVAVEEGTVALDEPAGGIEDVTVRHLLAHASGLPFEGDVPITRPETTRIYSNTGIEVVAAHLEAAAGIPFDTYLREAVLDPLGMTATTLGSASPAAGAVAPLGDLLRFAAELLAPTLVAPATLAEAVTVQYPGLKGRVPGIGPMDPCDWGLGFELRDGKAPHWTGGRNSPGTFGHFGGSGTFLWVDPAVGVACAALTDRPFDAWALQHWPEFSDAVLTETARDAATS
jgi:CubicO group peptidase (beta-lactamase class C family)